MALLDKQYKLHLEFQSKNNFNKVSSVCVCLKIVVTLLCGN